MEPTSDSWISSTGQSWKLFVFYILLASALSLFAMFIMKVNGREIVSLSEFQLSMAGVLTIAATLGWLIGAVRCSRCGNRPVWTLLKSEGAVGWFGVLYDLGSCPKCGAVEK